ncbi:endonuclease/exonuclease/phosphatase family protein [Bdellovibrionota bacterium FG-1]
MTSHPHQLRILSYNIHKGFNVGNRRFILEKIRHAIRTLHPDLVLLQEVLGEHRGHQRRLPEWPKLPQFSYLAHDLWPHFAYGKNAIYGAGHHGNAILSKYPIDFFENIDISTNPYEKRGLLHARVAIPGRHRPVHVICVHLGLFEAERQTQIKRICRQIDAHVPHQDPLILGGDFNDWLLKATGPLQNALEVKEAFLEMHGAHARTFPSWLPSLRLDRLYFRKMKLKSCRVLTQKPWNTLSDHVPLYAELSIQAGS